MPGRALEAGLSNPLGLNVNGLALLLIGVLALQAVFSFGHTYLLAIVGERSLADLRRDTYARLIRLPMAFFASAGSASWRAAWPPT